MWGGGKKSTGVWSGVELAPYVIDSDHCNEDSTYCYEGHYSGDTETMDIDGCIQATVPLSELSKSMSKTDLLTAMQVHGLFFYTLNTMKELRAALIEHEAKSLSCCTQSKSSFKILKSGKKSQEKTSTNQAIFPPKPPSESLKRQIIRDFCEEITPENITCSKVCLTCLKDLKGVRYLSLH